MRGKRCSQKHGAAAPCNPRKGVPLLIEFRPTLLQRPLRLCGESSSADAGCADGGGVVPGDTSRSMVEAISRTPLRRLGFELGASAVLGLATALGALMLHVRLAPLDVQTVMMHGTAVADDPANPQWFSVVCAQRGATGVLSRRAVDMDPAVAREIIAANRETAAHLPRVPTWSAVRDGSADERLAGSPSLFESAHGWSLSLLQRFERVDAAMMGAGAGERETASVGWALLPVGVMVNVVFFAVVWLVVIRMPASIDRTRQWLAAQRRPDAVTAA
jgi:hypothetical protein